MQTMPQIKYIVGVSVEKVHISLQMLGDDSLRGKQQTGIHITLKT